MLLRKAINFGASLYVEEPTSTLVQAQLDLELCFHFNQHAERKKYMLRTRSALESINTSVRLRSAEKNSKYETKVLTMFHLGSFVHLYMGTGTSQHKYLYSTAIVNYKRRTILVLVLVLTCKLGHCMQV